MANKKAKKKTTKVEEIKIEKANNKNKLIAVTVIVLTLLIAAIGVSYAYFSVNVTGNDNGSTSVIVKTGTMGLVYETGNYVTVDKALPGWNDTKTFTVTNTGTVKASYNIVWEDVYNEFEIENMELGSDLTYSVTGSFARARSGMPESNANILEGITIEAGETHTYHLKVEFLNRDYDQSENQGKTFTGKIIVTDSLFQVAYDGTNIIQAEQVSAGWNETKEVEVINNSPKAMKYSVLWEDVINTYETKSDLTYSVEGQKTVAETAAPEEDEVIFGNIEIPANTTHNYTVNIKYKEETGYNEPKIKRVSESNVFNANIRVTTEELEDYDPTAIYIKTANDLWNMRNKLNGKYILSKNIDMSTCTVAAGCNTTWTPLGTFSGSLDGKGKTITGIKISRGGVESTGFVTSLTGTIKNVVFKNTTVTGGKYTGGVAGKCSGTIDNVGFYGAVNNSGQYNDYVGGLVGDLVTNGRINKSYVGDGSSVSSIRYGAGGLAGHTGYTTYITNSYSTATVYAPYDYVGGLVGESAGKMTITNSFAVGNVTARAIVGGIVGYSSASGSLSNTITNVYASGKITGGTSGGLYGTRGTESVSNIYWVTDMTNQTTSPTGTGISSKIAARQSTYNNWNFTDVWAIEEGKSTPYLQGLPVPAAAKYENRDVYIFDGDGTQASPYLLKTAKDVRNIYRAPATYFKLVNDIVMDEGNFAPIASFNGTLDGDGYTISGIKVSQGGVESTGIIKSLTGTVKNIVFTNTTVTGGKYTGGVAGTSSGTIDGVGFYGTVNNTGQYNDNVGGLVGNFKQNGKINKSYVGEGSSVSSIRFGAGGLVGYHIYSATISNSYSAANVYAPYDYAGGLVGETGGQLTITNCYSVGNVTARADVGGIIGRSTATGSFPNVITNVYSSSKITGSSTAGGLYGTRGTEQVSNIYWVIPLSNQTASPTGTGIATLETARQATSYNWNIAESTVWGIDEGMSTPYLLGLTIPSNVYRNN